MIEENEKPKPSRDGESEEVLWTGGGRPPGNRVVTEWLVGQAGKVQIFSEDDGINGFLLSSLAFV